LGKRTQPFGLFETHFVTDPLTQDADETQTVGVSAGLKVPLETDLSLTFYKGRVQSDHLYASGLFDPAAAPVPAVTVARVDSWILSGISTPVKDIWTVFAACSSEPGAGRRMTTLGLGSNLVIPGLKNLQIDAEYMRALGREDVHDLGRSFRETAVSVTASYQFVLRPRTLRGGGNYRSRKSQRLSRPAEMALRFEAYACGLELGNAFDDAAGDEKCAVTAGVVSAISELDVRQFEAQRWTHTTPGARRPCGPGSGSSQAAARDRGRSCPERRRSDPRFLRRPCA
jgi:hypothetical protein